MPRPKGWLKPADQWVLEHLQNTDYATPKDLSEELDYNNDYLSNRCRKLQAAGLLENIGDRGVYSITDRGESYLDGEIGADELEEPE